MPFPKISGENSGEDASGRHRRHIGLFLPVSVPSFCLKRSILRTLDFQRGVCEREFMHSISSASRRSRCCTMRKMSAIGIHTRRGKCLCRAAQSVGSSVIELRPFASSMVQQSDCRCSAFVPLLLPSRFRGMPRPSGDWERVPPFLRLHESPSENLPWMHSSE